MSNVTIENVRMLFRNFSGKEGKFNPKGDRNFSICLDENLAKSLSEDGWNVRYLKPRNEDEPPQAMLQIKVLFGKNPPQIMLLGSNGRTLLNENNVNILDWAEIENVDVIFRPYEWTVNGVTGIKAYLKKMYVTIVEDELEKKYQIRPDSAQDAIGGCGNCEVCTGDCGEVL